MAPSKKCRHDRERVTYCAECEEVLPPRYSTDGIMLSTLQVLKAHGATLDTIKLAVQGQPMGEALVDAVAATPEPDEELIHGEQRRRSSAYLRSGAGTTSSFAVATWAMERSRTR